MQLLAAISERASRHTRSMLHVDDLRATSNRSIGGFRQRPRSAPCQPPHEGGVENATLSPFSVSPVLNCKVAARAVVHRITRARA